MKLPKITNEDPLVSKKINLHQSVLALVDAYRDSYKQHYGETLPLNDLTEHCLKIFIESDRDFMKKLKKKSIISDTVPNTPVAASSDQPTVSLQ